MKDGLLALDVTSGDQVTAAVEAAEERFGAIDVLINNAGYGYRAAVEEGPVRGLLGPRPWFVPSWSVARSASVRALHAPRNPAPTDA